MPALQGLADPAQTWGATPSASLHEVDLRFVVEQPEVVLRDESTGMQVRPALTS
jgi:hypothetical protein